MPFPCSTQTPQGDFNANSQETAASVLSKVTTTAQAAGVDCELVSLRNSQPYRAFVDAARERGCDLIFISSHGRRGLGAPVLGSETTKMLTYSKIPGLVLGPIGPSLKPKWSPGRLARGCCTGNCATQNVARASSPLGSSPLGDRPPFAQLGRRNGTLQTREANNALVS